MELSVRRRKLREEKPFAVMPYDLESIRRYSLTGAAEEKLLVSIQRPSYCREKRGQTAFQRRLRPIINISG